MNSSPWFTELKEMIPELKIVFRKYSMKIQETIWMEEWGYGLMKTDKIGEALRELERESPYSEVSKKIFN